MIIRKAQYKDTFEIATVQVISASFTYRNIIPKDHLQKMNINDREKIWTEIIKNEDGEIYVLEENQTIKGYIHFGKTRDEDKANLNVAEIYSIYLLPDEFKKGYGTLLLEYAIKLLSVNFKEINIWVIDENINAKAFYYKLGFIDDHKKIITAGGKDLKEIRVKLVLS